MSEGKVQLSREQALVLLTEGDRGVLEWNEHYGVGHAARDLHGLELANAQLAGVELADTDLSETRLLGANLRRANLARADLTDADLREADLAGADLSEAVLIQANLNRCELSGARLLQAKLSYASLIKTSLQGADLGQASLNRAHLHGADLSRAVLNNARLSAAELTDANLREADLNGADLGEADLRGADLSYANLENANLAGAELDGATLEGVRLQEAKLSKTKLDPDVDLLVLDWSTLTLDGTIFRRDAVESGAQSLPGAPAPLRITFSLEDEVTTTDLQTLQQLVKSGSLPRGTRISLAFTASGPELVLEGRGKLDQAALLGAVLIALPRLHLAEGQQPDVAPASSTLETSLRAARSSGLLACAKKLNRVCVRPRAGEELERFRSLFHQHGSTDDAVVANQVVTLLRRTRTAERLMLDALGFGSSWQAAEDSEREAVGEAGAIAPNPAN